MSSYYLIILWFAGMWVVFFSAQTKRKEYVLGEYTYRTHPLYAYIAFAPVIIWAGWRDDFVDTWNYRRLYQEVFPTSLNDFASYMGTVTKDKAFYAFSALIRICLGNKEVVYFLIIAMIQGIILIAVYRKYSTNYLLSIFLFVISADYLSWMFNGIRQFMAVTIIFAGTALLVKKKYVPLIVLVLIASLFHQSALLFIPFVFIVQGKAWNKKTILFVIGVILVVAFVGRFTNLLDAALSETQYTNVVSDWKEFEDNGTSVLRVLVYSVPMIMSLLGLRYIEAENNPIINICTNMSIVTTGFYVVSIFTSGIFIGRLPIYFSLYNYILLPWEIEHMFEKRSQQVITLVMILSYLYYYYYQIHVGWGVV